MNSTSYGHYVHITYVQQKKSMDLGSLDPKSVLVLTIFCNSSKS